jgi:molybdopterin-guanine dinucleotide biosynthesis protein A
MAAAAASAGRPGQAGRLGREGPQGEAGSGGDANPPGRRSPCVRLAAVVLAGGQASRLGGADKPGLVVGTRSLLAAVVSAAVEAGAGHVVVGLAAAAGPSGQLDFVREDPPGSGPVAALRAGLAAISAPAVAVLAADMPFLAARHLRALLEAAGLQDAGAGAASGSPGPLRAAGLQDAGADAVSGSPGPRPGHAARAGQAPCGAVLLDDGGRPQWLAGCWAVTVLRGQLARYGGDSLHGLLHPLQPVRLSYPLAGGEPPPWLDCDVAADLSLAREWHGRF